LSTHGLTLDFDEPDEDGFSVFIGATSISEQQRTSDINRAEFDDFVAESEFDADSHNNDSTDDNHSNNDATAPGHLQQQNGPILRRSLRRNVIRIEPYTFISPPFWSHNRRVDGKHYDLNHLPVHSLGQMDRKCRYCRALYFDCEKNHQGVYFKCCHNGKVPDPNIPPPLPVIRNLIKNDKIFLRDINYYNNAFALASIGFNFKQFPNRGIL
jgi:hypothetical protein